MVASGLMAFFDIRPKYDSEGLPIPLTAEMKQNILVSQPLPFEVDIKPRSEHWSSVRNRNQLLTGVDEKRVSDCSKTTGTTSGTGFDDVY
ncbi:unnamed protein product [Rhizoctonia solani]|uniref:Uncharacterized protein n=1 Tax=Rhizoctonia solani TaxID=456999 RepID=A0A8H3CQM6_9AGAM|nr:unnamed protein product [Rhizoctonia solani]